MKIFTKLFTALLFISLSAFKPGDLTLDHIISKHIELFGKDDVDGTECYKIKMTDKNAQETTFYIDPTNFYVIKQTQKIKADGKEIEASTTYGDYKKLPEGIVYPMSVNGGWGESS